MDCKILENNNHKIKTICLFDSSQENGVMKINGIQRVDIDFVLVHLLRLF